MLNVVRDLPYLPLINDRCLLYAREVTFEKWVAFHGQVLCFEDALLGRVCRVEVVDQLGHAFDVIEAQVEDVEVGELFELQRIQATNLIVAQNQFLQRRWQQEALSVQRIGRRLMWSSAATHQVHLILGAVSRPRPAQLSIGTYRALLLDLNDSLDTIMTRIQKLKLLAIGHDYHQISQFAIAYVQDDYLTV